MAGRRTLLLLLISIFYSVAVGATRPVTPIHRSLAIKAGYWPSWLGEKYPPSSITTSYLTHFFYAFVEPDATTYRLTITDDQWMHNFSTTLHTKNPNAKTLLSIGGGASNPDTFSKMASNPSTRATFIHSTIEVARKYGFDGLDLDWEFPKTQQDMSNLALLFNEWRTAVSNESVATRQPQLLLTAAVYFSPVILFYEGLPAFPADAIRTYLDFVSPMCFDYRGSWDTSVTGSHAALYDSRSNYSTSYGIPSWIKAGVPAYKLVMGLPLYGRTWKLKDSSVHGIRAPAVGTGPGDNGTMTYVEVVDFNKANSATEVFDETTVSTYSYAGTDWIGYDNATSIKKKMEFAQSHGLRGYFFWALGYDKDDTLTREASTAWDH